MLKIYNGDCLAVMATLEENSIDAVVTDPPYGLNFMNKHWDYQIPSVDIWREVIRVLKPGGHMLCFGGSRTHHRIWCNIEDAGFEIRDTLMWIYGSGFPKGLNVSKAIDKHLGYERKTGILATQKSGKTRNCMAGDFVGEYRITAPSSDEAEQWEGWNVNLKPAFEPIILARKPLSEKTVARNVLRWGTGAINIDACRVSCEDKPPFPVGIISDTSSIYGGGKGYHETRPRMADTNVSGRWPANVLHDGSDEVLEAFAEYGEGHARGNKEPSKGGGGMYGHGKCTNLFGAGDTGSAARFFYSSKAGKLDRCDSKHPTVKPIKLLEYLVRLITPMGGIVLDPFAGSGTTGQAAINLGMGCVLIEQELEYYQDCVRRLALWL